MSGTLVAIFERVHIDTTRDALIAFEAYLSGEQHGFLQRPLKGELQEQKLIRGGNVFIYNEHQSGIKCWTDGMSWGSSRILGDFLVYRELQKPQNQTPLRSEKPNGLVKKTRSASANWITPTPPPAGPWAATPSSLSYFIVASSGRLTTANIHAKKKDIDVDSLGKTIKDAMEITRALGLRFLWVDSQCIIQDSAEDWQLESARMGSIYHNSEVTISASGGTHSDSGLLGPRETSRMAPVPLKFTAPDESVGTVFLRHDGMFGRVPDEPLDKRGWTLQEGLLSRRLLSFGRQQITWECGSGYKTENGALLQEQEHFLGLPRPIRKPRRYDPIPKPIAELLRHRSEAVLTWEFIVNAFTERTLSFSTDKLPALSGIAQHVQKTRPDDTYLIGMWKADLPWCLLWGVGTQAQRPPAYRAPSWSWASLEGRVVCFGDQHGWWGQDAHAHCVVEDVVVSPKGLNGRPGRSPYLVFGLTLARAASTASSKLTIMARLLSSLHLIQERSLTQHSSRKLFLSDYSFAGTC
ncbi:hypothetical protein CDV31_012255 [Fusarium ambrosium]|uniref:Heterokaryon incompatibility domain-containing protein n=1 Tax=Fusarium ambrosium TaxID=131363 RepID=A0A428TB39_9HYPO|nr:hypothetical protein CDV31_012255 [Fusarium ambrosium]